MADKSKPSKGGSKNVQQPAPKPASAPAAPTASASPPSPGPTPAAQPQVQVQIIGQYIKDLSFENPSLTALLNGPGENPNMNLEINVNAKKISDDAYESAIDFRADLYYRISVVPMLLPG